MRNITGDQILAEMLALKEENERLKEALKFYAEGNWNDNYPGGVDCGDSIIDMGHRARQALKE